MVSLLFLLFFFFFFFFQAEDGIRDWSVTGVQTCALPISLDRQLGLHVRRRRALGEQLPAEADVEHLDRRVPRRVRLARGRDERSEERRVGKECRYRGSPEKSEKKEVECEGRASDRQ